MRLAGLVFTLLLVSACASEEWDNRFDPESEAYRAPCSGVADDFASGCLFWEDFDAGLSRWLLTPSPSGVKAPKIVERGPYDTVSGVLALPGCDGRGPSIVTEVVMPGGEVDIRAIWTSNPETKGKLALDADGTTLSLAEGPAEESDLSGWTESVTTLFTRKDQPVALRLLNVGEAGDNCELTGLFVARFWVSTIDED